MIRFERRLRGVPLWLLREYLQELGGWPEGENTVRADGWQAKFSQGEDFVLGSLRVGQVHLEVESTPEAWVSLQPALERKLLRAGG